ncbi:cytochrome ubiquinol oxidase subunit I [Polymorphobacter multimanifer]|uniref:cytochrome c oxidase subunit I n=1 Tax=Polymorphobacter multimanifer TaxID=1070431 RepID=UPI0019B7F7A3|nr:cytochrome c oxidase subunit I [Polymorphobacter multimanifer]GGI81210.1 cytochrome ubiquinol oxidase subunit I [Polymorphobacter multimanifer]
MTALRRHRAMHAIWDRGPGLRGALGTVNHSDVGRRFIITAFVFFCIGRVLAMLIRTQLATPGSAFVGPAIYNQLFTMHGSIMMFLFAIPMIEGLAFYMLPKLLGARDMAFPRLSAFGYWCYLFGGTILVLSLFFGVAPDSGWFMYTPLSSKPFTPGINADVWLIGVTFVEVSAMAAAIEIMVSVLKLRAPGLRIDRMPLFAWYLLVTALMMLIGFPPLILGSILLELERAFDWPFFDPNRGGDPLLWQHLFWLFGHPEVYIIFLPAAGVVSTVLPVMARTRIIGYGWIIAAILALAILSFGLWVHHMFTTGIPHMALGFFSAASALVAIPTGIQIFAWIGTIWAGRPELKLPMLHILGFFVVFIIGGLTGVMLAMVPFNWQAHDTAFVTAHLHYVLVGGFVFPMLAGAVYWLPHFTGRQPIERLGKAAFWLIFIGFNLTFLMMHMVGLLGQPRRIYSYPEAMGWTWYNLLASFGSFIMAFGFALFALDVALQIWLGRHTQRNPWRAGTLEWAMPLPAPSYNFASLPSVSDFEPVTDDPQLALKLACGEGFLGEPRHGWRETMGSHMLTGRPEYIVLLPGNTLLPLLTAVMTGGFFVSILAGVYALAPVFLVAVAIWAWRWAWTTTNGNNFGVLAAGHELALPVHAAAPGSPGDWGSVFAIVADGSLFATLVFGYAYLWPIAGGWPPPALIAASPIGVLVALAVLAGASLAARKATAVRATLTERRRFLWMMTGAQVVALALLIHETATAIPPPSSHAYAATVMVLFVYAAFHVALALLLTGFALARIRAGFVSDQRTVDVRVAAMWHGYALAVTAVVLLATKVPAMLA